MIEAATLRTLWDSHSDRLLLIARAIGEPAEDAVQEAFVALATQAKLPDDPLAWLVRVTRNQLLQWHRGRTRRRSREQAVGNQSWFSGGFADVEQKLDGDAVSAVIRMMPSPQREIIVMHIWGEMTFESIAEVVGGSRASAHRSFQRGLEQLKQQFNPDAAKHEQTTNTNY